MVLHVIGASGGHTHSQVLGSIINAEEQLLQIPLQQRSALQQDPLQQTVPALQAAPQAPQLLGSVKKLTHSP